MKPHTGKTIGELIASGDLSLDTKVVGDLPITADGWLLGDHAHLWWHDHFEDNKVEEIATTSLHGIAGRDGGWVQTATKAYQQAFRFYATKEACEAAKPLPEPFAGFPKRKISTSWSIDLKDLMS